MTKRWAVGKRKLMTDPELETLKSGIDLRAYAAGQGYVWDKHESWRGSTVMRAPDGDKVIIQA